MMQRVFLKRNEDVKELTNKFNKQRTEVVEAIGVLNEIIDLNASILGEDVTYPIAMSAVPNRVMEQVRCELKQEASRRCNM
jgi:hypothetical protein